MQWLPLKQVCDIHMFLIFTAKDDQSETWNDPHTIISIDPQFLS